MLSFKQFSSEKVKARVLTNLKLLVLIKLMSVKSLKNIVVFSSFLALLVFVLSSVAKAADTGTVAATVTVQSVSVTVTDGTIAYGTLAVNTSADTNPADTQTATNNGNITENLNIKGKDDSPWILDSANSTQDHYIHMFCIATCGTPPTNYTALTTSYQTLATGVVATSGTQTFDLYITTPQSSSVYTQRSVDVTVQAIAP